jgi:hypothetical protein
VEGDADLGGPCVDAVFHQLLHDCVRDPVPLKGR